MLPTTRAQREAVKRAYDRDRDLLSITGETYLQFRRRFGWSGVASDVYLFGQMPAGYWLGIELDGYAHS